MNAPKILSFKVVKKGKRRGVEVTHEQQYVDTKGSIVNIESPKQFHAVEPHEDLSRLMLKLSPHWAMLTEREEFDEASIENAGVIERAAADYPVTSILWKEGKNWNGVQVHGHKVLRTGHAANTLTRLVKFNTPNDGYALLDELEELTEQMRAEVALLLGGKHAKPAQTSLTDPDQAEDGDNGDE